MARKIKSNDNVVVIAGKDRGKAGRVLRVVEDGKRVIVERINMIKRHTRPTAENQQGGIIEREAPINVSNVMLFDSETGRASRVGFKVDAAGTKVRVDRKTGAVLDS